MCSDTTSKTLILLDRVTLMHSNAVLVFSYVSSSKDVSQSVNRSISFVQTEMTGWIQFDFGDLLTFVDVSELLKYKIPVRLSATPNEITALILCYTLCLMLIKAEISYSSILFTTLVTV